MVSPRINESPQNQEFWPININIISNNINGQDTASLIEFSINESFYKDEIPQYVYTKYVELLEWLTGKVDSVGGMITLDTMSTYCSFSAHERYMGLSYLSASTNFNRFFRGYSWGNFLSQNHVSQLGGIDKIMKEAPVFLVKSLKRNGAYLQLTEDINCVSDDDLRNLKRYFETILPKASLMLFPNESWYRRMIIEDDDEIRFLQK